MKNDPHYKPAQEMRADPLHGNGSQSGTYYKVEVRCTSTMPKVIGDVGAVIPFVIDNYWRELGIGPGPTKWGVNIPIRSWEADACKQSGLVSYIAAEAHRWAFLAALEAATPGGALCIETRLVAVEFSQTYTTKEVGVSEPTGHSYRPPTIAPRFPADEAEAKAA